ncbi:polysaccharide deacetylase family protein [Nocardioides xinjiangensis]|uniref:polysaccharide deacetylase family protein n=1 Tax=Nocardioides xinjiangensis TaxID=2817376 RepID=UPI001B3086C7|nr:MULTISPECIES: polysaccharide deacetylase family protein [unclassified Nocardioides]
MTRVPVLMYHSVAGQASARFRPWVVHPRRFAAHMEHLSRHGYRSLTLSQLEDHLRPGGPPMPDRPVVITFDDGFADFHSTALPVLEAHHLMSTLYVATGYLGGTARWLAREREQGRPMLHPEQLHDVADRGVEIGAHSHTHPRLDELSATEARAEIRRSKDVLEQELQRPVATFAYPHGYYSRRVRDQVIEAGYTSSTAVRHAMSSTEDDVFARARLMVLADTSTEELERLLRGDGVPQAPFRPRPRTALWRTARRTRRALTPARRGPRAA